MDWLHSHMQHIWSTDMHVNASIGPQGCDHRELFSAFLMGWSWRAGLFDTMSLKESLNCILSHFTGTPNWMSQLSVLHKLHYKRGDKKWLPPFLLQANTKTRATTNILLSIIPFITLGRQANESCTASIILLLCLHLIEHPLLNTLITMLCGKQWERENKQKWCDSGL